MVVTKTLEAIAGSMFIFLSVTGTKIPNKPATTMVKIIEMDIIKEFLPQQMNEEELRDALTEIINDVNASSMKDMGKVMGMASKEMVGKADGKTISTIVKQKLNR